MSKLNTYWISYSYTYDVFDTDENNYVPCEDFDEGRFQCKKSDIKKTVENYIIDDLTCCGEPFKNLKVKINNYYITTEYEI